MRKVMILAAVLLFSQMAGVTSAMAEEVNQKMAQARKQMPSLYGLSDEMAVSVIRDIYYQHMTLEQVASGMGVVLPPPKPELGPIDKWRYESCQQDAATAPTSQGVIVKLRICRQKFGQ